MNLPGLLLSCARRQPADNDPFTSGLHSVTLLNYKQHFHI